METSCDMNSRELEPDAGYHPSNGASWMKRMKGVFELNKDFYQRSVGILKHHRIIDQCSKFEQWHLYIISNLLIGYFYNQALNLPFTGCFKFITFKSITIVGLSSPIQVSPYGYIIKYHGQVGEGN